MSNATKTVSNAQADREKRQADRQRLKAAGNIQRTWRGHRARRSLRETHRATFDELYSSDSIQGPQERLPQAFGLLLSFFSSRRKDDVERLVYYARDAESVDFKAIAPVGIFLSRLQKCSSNLVTALDEMVKQG